MSVTKAVALRIRELTANHDITLYRLEKMSGILHGTLAAIMGEKTKTVTISTILMICAGLNIDITEFFNSEIFKDLQID